MAGMVAPDGVVVGWVVEAGVASGPGTLISAPGAPCNQYLRLLHSNSVGCSDVQRCIFHPGNPRLCNMVAGSVVAGSVESGAAVVAGWVVGSVMVGSMVVKVESAVQRIRVTSNRIPQCLHYSNKLGS